MTPVWLTIVVLILLSAVIVAGVAVLWHAVKAIRLQRKTLRWERVVARVIVPATLDTPVSYRYCLEGNAYVGTQIRREVHATTDSTCVQEFTASFQPGVFVLAFVNPQVPEQSVLVAGPARSTFALASVGILLIVAGAGFMAVGMIAMHGNLGFASGINVALPI